MTDHENLDVQDTNEAPDDHLKFFVEEVEEAIARREYVAAGRLIEDDVASAWFASVLTGSSPLLGC